MSLPARIPGGRWWVPAFLCMAAVMSALPAMAQSFNPGLMSGMHWRLLGPFRAGRSVAAAGVPSQPNVFYFGAVDGGVWKTTNAGTTWTPIFDDEPIASIGAIAVAPSDPNVIYVGTGEADPRSQISYGDGMYKSTDAGKTWTHIGLDKSMHIGEIIVDPANPNRVFVAVLGNLYAANPERGVYASTDGGQSWKQVLYKNENVGAIDLAFAPGNAQVIYAALWATRRPPWSVYPPSNGPGGGLYKSTDGGATWTQLGHGLPTEGVGKIGVAVAPGNPNRVYAIIDAKQGGLYRSDDAGATWKLADGEARIWGRGWYFDRVTVDPKNPDKLYVMNTSTYRSTDGGKSFEAIKGAPGGDDYHRLWVNPNDPDRMVLSSDQGTIVSVDGARSWSSWNNQPTGQMYHITADNRDPFWVYGAMQDSGGHPVSTDVSRGRITYRYWDQACTGGESNGMAADPLSEAELYGISFTGITRCNAVTGANQSISPLDAYPGEAFRKTWTLPVVFSMADKHAVYYSNQFLFRSTDGGQNWDKISPDLSRARPGIPANLDPTTAADTTYAQQTGGSHWGVIYTIAPSPLVADTVWAGTDDGLIWHTVDGGKHWQDVTPKSVTPWSKVIMLDASHFDVGTAYAAIDRHRLNDYGPHVLRTTDGGKTWHEVDAGLPHGAYVMSVKQDPGRKGMVFAGTSTGVYVSFDSGAQWQSLKLNMPTVEIRDFVFHDNSVAIATFGRGFWILDDLSPLHQLTPDMAQSAAYLFKPETAIAHTGQGGFSRGSSLKPAANMDPIEVWSGEPRMQGAILDYYLKADAQGPVTLEILDAGGKVIRHYASTDKFPQQDPKTMDVPAVWRAEPTPLPAKAGMHRVAWDLKAIAPGAPAPTGIAAFFGSGTAVLPGQYTVKLTVDGQSYSAPLTVQMDPGIQYRMEALQAQAQLVDQIKALQGKVGAAAHDIAGLRKQLAALGPQAAGQKRLAAAIAAFDQKAKVIEGFAAKPAPDSSGEGAAEPTPESLKGLSSTLMRMSFSAAQGGVEPPTPALVTGYGKVQQTADATLAKSHELETTDVDQLNAKLTAAKLPPISL